MANDGRIDVYFHDGTTAASETDSQAEENSPNGNKKAKGNSVERSAIVSGIVQYSKKAISEGTQVFADLTGDYQAKRNIDGVMNLVGTAVMMAHFPVGTIAGAVTLTTSAINQVVSNIKANREASLLMKRSGNETINESEV